MALTVKAIARLTEPGRYGDGRGLYLQVTKTGARSWIYRYERHGRERMFGLGSVSDVTLDEARESARQARLLLREGRDPIDERREQRLAHATTTAQAAALNVTFDQCSQQYYKFHSAKWTNTKHAAQFLSSLRAYAYPALGQVPVAAIDKALVLKALEPIWYAKTETASRVRGRIEAVLDFAKTRGYRTGENPASWGGNLAHVLPPRAKVKPVEHHAALPFSEIPAFMEQLAALPGIPARALEFAILTAARSGEAIGARWTEIDLEAGVWTVPAERMKAKKEHRIPLSEPTLAILRALPREADYVFPGGRKNAPVSVNSLSEVLKHMERSDVTVHGFRSTFRDYVAERTNYANHIVEMALAHTIGNQVEAAYRRGDLFAKRARLMADWARFCSAGAGAAGIVTAIRARS